MTRNKEIPGSQSGRTGREKKIEAWTKERSRAAVGKHMRTFRNTKKRQLMTTYDDDDYIRFLLNTVESGDCQYFGDACVEAYSRGQQVGNMKDEVAAQKTALLNTCDNGLELLLDLSAQWPLDNLMANFPRSDTITVLGTGAATEATVAHYEEATMSNIFQRMQGLELPVVLREVLKDMNFYFKVADEWKDVANNDIPSMYVIPRLPLNASATNIALITALWAEQGELKNHAKKFGIKLASFDQDWLKPRETTYGSKDGLAYFMHAPINYRDSIATNDRQKYGLNPVNADVSESKKWWFYEDPNESKINYLAKLLYPYNVTYNKYGGAMSGALVPTGADSFCMTAKFTESVELEVKDIILAIDIAKQFLATWENGAALCFELTGTDVSNFDLDTTNSKLSWWRSKDENLFYGTGIDELSSDQTYLSYLIELMF